MGGGGGGSGSGRGAGGLGEKGGEQDLHFENDLLFSFVHAEYYDQQVSKQQPGRFFFFFAPSSPEEKMRFIYSRM